MVGVSVSALLEVPAKPEEVFPFDSEMELPTLRLTV